VALRCVSYMPQLYPPISARTKNLNGEARRIRKDGRGDVDAHQLGIELRLRVEPDGAWLTIKRPGEERQYRDIPESDVPALVAEFEAIGESPERFCQTQKFGHTGAALAVAGRIPLPKCRMTRHDSRHAAFSRLPPRNGKNFGDRCGRWDWASKARRLEKSFR
jgi:hypothetical protein